MTMKNKTVLITGATGGIGKQTTISLAALGAKVIITGRNQVSGDAAVQEIRSQTNNNNVSLIISDLSSISGVQHLAKTLLSQNAQLDVLINNAGSAANVFTTNEEGIEINFATNVVAPFLLSNLLMGTLSKSDDGRIVTLMGGDLPDEIDLQNMQGKKGFKGLNAYSQSKMVMMSLMYEFALRSKNSKVTINICYPGQASTSMTQGVTAKMFPLLFRPLFPIFKYLIRPDGGASAKATSKSSLFLASSDDVRGKTALYVDRQAKISDFPSAAIDPSNRLAIWNYISDLIVPLGVNLEFLKSNKEEIK